MPDPPAGAEVRAADVSDPSASRAAFEGAATVYHCANPPYTEWPRLLPALAHGILEGAAAAGARLVYGDNLYAYGAVEGPIREDCPPAATGVKGRLRAEIARRWLEAHRAGRVRVAIARASDFVGPWADAGSHLGARVFRPLLAGKPAQFIGNPDLPHTFTYIRDVARAMVTLAGSERAFGEVWHVPSPATWTPRQWVALIAEEASLARPRVQGMPGWTVRGLGRFVPILREIAEMLYSFERPYVVDHSKFERAFGTPPTPHREIVRETLAWYRGRVVA
jgi:nucleoside-diphosphate-sugar epimerase